MSSFSKKLGLSLYFFCGVIACHAAAKPPTLISSNSARTTLPLVLNAQVSQRAQQLRLLKKAINHAKTKHIDVKKLKVFYEQYKKNTQIKPTLAYSALHTFSEILPTMYSVAYQPYHKQLIVDTIKKGAQKINRTSSNGNLSLQQAICATLTRAACTCTPPPNWITTTKIQVQAITSTRLAQGAVTTEKIAPEAVTTSKIAPNAVTKTRIANGSVTSDELANNAVTSAKIAGSISDSKLATITTSGKVANSATTATSANTASAIIARDASGNFTASTITADTVTGLDTPSASTDAANKAYVDATVQGLQIKNPVAAMENVSNITTLAGLLTIDGYTLLPSDRVLLNHQTDGKQNGIWQVGATNPYTWTRPSDFLDGSSAAFAYTTVTNGNIYYSTGWVCTNYSPFTVGTSLLAFTQFSGLAREYMENIGDGTGEVYKEKVQATFKIRTLKQGSNTAITTDSDVVNIDTATNISIPGTVGVGTGLTVSAGGATITGTTTINTSGAATTTIGGAGTVGKISVAAASTTLGTGSTSGNTLLLQAHDTTGGGSTTTFATLTAASPATMDLSDSVTKAGGYIYRAGGTTIPINQGGTGATSLTSNSLLLGGASTLTALGTATNGQIPIGSTGAAPVLGTITSTAGHLTVTNGTGTINIDTPAVLQTDTGFGEWSGTTPYFDDATIGQFTLLKGGSGYIKGVYVSWSGPQTVSLPTSGETYYIYIDSSGTIGATTTYSDELFTNNIVLFECLRDQGTTPTNNQVTVKENHPYHHPTWVSLYEHDVIGTVIKNVNNGANIAINAGDPKTLQINGDDMLEEHGLETEIPDSGGQPIIGRGYYTNASGKWCLDNLGISTEFGPYWNNAGTITELDAGHFAVFTIYVSKDNLNTSYPTYIGVMDTSQYASQSTAATAIANGTPAKATNELAALEVAQLGYIIYSKDTDQIIQAIVSKETLRSTFSTGGTNQASLVNTTTTAFNNILSATNTNVQSALDKIDSWGAGTTTAHGILVGQGAAVATTAITPGATGTVLAGVTGTDPAFTATPTVTSVTTTGGATLAGGTNTLTGTTNINATASAGNTSIGNTGNIVGITGSTNTISGTTNINTATVADSTIGYGTTDTVTLHGGTNTITGTANINTTGSVNTNISATSNTGSVNIGNASSTAVTVLGPATINATGIKSTQIGNASSYVGIGGIADGSHALAVTGAATISNGLTVPAGGAAITGTTTINTAGNANTTIGTGGSDTVTLQGKYNTIAGDASITGTTTLNTTLTGFLKAVVGAVSAQTQITTAETDATSTDTASTLVTRDEDGNFAATTITASKVTGLNAPTDDTDAANKAYVISNAAGLNVKDAVRLVSVSDVANIHTVTGAITIDGQIIASGNRILLTAQTSGNGAKDNGIWSASTTAAWTRPTDFDTGASAARAYCLVTAGTTYANTGWYCTTSPAVIGTDDLTFVQFSAVNTYSMQNVGTGAGVYRDQVANVCSLRKLNSDSANLTITQNTDDITFSPNTNPTLTGATIQGITAINASSGGSTTQIGSNANNQYVGIGGAADGSHALKITGATDITNGLTIDAGGATVTGTTTINSTGSANTSIGTESNSGITAIGNALSTTTMLGATTINATGTNNTQIGLDGSNHIGIGGAPDTGYLLTVNGTSKFTQAIFDTGGITISAGGATINGTTAINDSNNAATTINTGTSPSNVTLGNTNTPLGGNSVSLYGLTNNIGQIGTSTSTNTIIGTTTINASANLNTSINTGSSTGIAAIGNSLSTTTIAGVTTINDSVNKNTSINTGTSTGTAAIGNSLSTTTIAGATTINNGINANTSINNGGSTGTVTIGNSLSTVNVNGTTTILGSTDINHFSGSGVPTVIGNANNTVTLAGATTINNTTNATTQINASTSTSAVTIGNSLNTVNVYGGLNNVGQASSTNTITGTTNVHGVTTINTTVSDGNTSIGNAGNTVGISGTTDTIVGSTAVNINNSGSGATNIGTSATAGTTMIGNTGRTVNIVGTADVTGTTTINTTGTATTTIGGSGTVGKIAVAATSTTLGTGGTASNTLLLQARNTNLLSDTTFATLTAGNPPTMDLSDSVTKAGSYIYRAGGTTIPISQGGTGATSLTANSLLLGGASAVTSLGAATNGQIPIGSTSAAPVLGNITSAAGHLTVTNGAGTINIDTPAVLQTDTGFGAWENDTPPFFDDATIGTFKLTKGGSGFIKGVAVSWTASAGSPQTVSLPTSGETYWIYIDSTGTIGATTTYSDDLFTNYIVLFECLRDQGTTPTNNQVTVKENHPYHHPMWVSLYEHDVIGCVIANTNNGANIAINAGNPKTLQINGDDELEDHGLETDVPDSGGEPIIGRGYFTNAGGKWVLDNLGISSEFGPYWNNGGTITELSAGYFAVFTIYASKDNINTADPTYIGVMDTSQYASQAAALTAIANGTTAKATNELSKLELARLGFIIYSKDTDRIVQAIIDKETLKPSFTANGLNQAALVSTTTTAFNNILSAANTNVQSALDKIDSWGAGTTTAHGIIVGQGASVATTAITPGSTGTVLVGVTGLDPAFTATPTVTSVITTGGATLAGGTNTLTGTTNINATASAGNTSIGNTGNTVGITASTNTIAGTTNINVTGNAATTIGTGSSDTVTLQGFANAINGTANINVLANANNTNLNTGSNTGTVSIGNASSTAVTVLGSTTINATGIRSTQIGNASSYVGIGGIADGSHALAVTGAATISNGLTVSAGGAAITGTTTINTAGNANTTIGTGGSDTVTLQGKYNTIAGDASITGTTTLNSTLTGFLKATAGVVSAQATIATTDTDATSTDTASRLVKRDSSGNFAATTITATTVTGLNSPSDNTDAANKLYVDTNATGLVVKSPVRLISVNNIANIHTGTGAITIDGQTIADGNRILLTNQTSTTPPDNGAKDNGIWIAQTGSTWTRPADFNTGDSAAKAYCLVTAGTTYANTGWYCTSSPAVIDTNDLTFVQFTAVNSYSMQNVGTGAGVYRDTVGTVCSLRKLNSDSANLTITQNTDDITFSPNTNPTLTGATIQGITAINASSGGGTTQIGSNANNQYVGIGGAADGSHALKVTGAADITNGLTIDAGGATVTGTTTINSTGSANTSIGTGTNSGITAIGNSLGTTTMLGATTINATGTNNTQIGLDGSNHVGIGGAPDTGYLLTVNGTSKFTQAIFDTGGVTVSAGGATISGITAINDSNNAATTINTGTSTSTSTIGNSLNAVNVYGGTNTIGQTSSTNTIIGATTINASANLNTSINTGSSTGTTAIGNSLSTNTVAGVTTINDSVNKNTSINTGTSTGIVAIGNSLSTNTVAGVTTINDSINKNTSINTGTSTGTTAIGNALSTTTIAGTTTINNGVNVNTSINNGGSTGTITIGNAASTTTMLGATNINNTGSAITQINATSNASTVNIGNSLGTVDIYGGINNFGQISSTNTITGTTNAHGVTTINTSISDGNTSIGNNSNTVAISGTTNINNANTIAAGVNIGTGTAYTGTVAIANGTGASTVGIGNSSSTLNLAGTTNINTANSINTGINIGTGTTYAGTIAIANTSGASTVSIGNSASTLTLTGTAGITGVTTINGGTSSNTNINTGTNTGTVAIADGTGASIVNIGNSASTLTLAGTTGISGTTNINTANTIATGVNIGTGTAYTGTVAIANGTGASTVGLGNSSSTLNLAGTTNINTANTIATGVNIGTGTTYTGTVAIANNTGASTVGIGNSASTLTLAGTTGITGITSINAGASNNTNINTGTNTGTVAIANGTGASTVGIGNSASTLTLAGTTGITGITSINAGASNNTNINTGTNTGTVAIANGSGASTVNIGNNASTLTLAGTTNINTANSIATGVNIGTGTSYTGIVAIANNTGASTVRLGNSSSTLTLTGTTGIAGATTINSTGAFGVNINTGTSTGSTQIGVNGSSYTGIGGAADAVTPYALKVTGDTNITGNLTVGGTISGTFIPVGTILPYAGLTAPAGDYVLCDGTGYATTGTYANLYAVIGYAYGGSGSTFNVPDLRAFFPVGYKSGDALFGTLNNTGGTRTATLTITELPAHTHTITDPQHTHTITQTAHSHVITDPGHTHTNNVINSNTNGALKIRTSNSSAGTATSTTNSNTTGVTVNTTSITISNNSAATGITATNSAGSGSAFSTLPPYRTINYIIKY